MKKLLFAAIAALTIGSTFAMTADEALASKNFYIIDAYCKSNGIASTPTWIAKSNQVSFADFNTIYYTITNVVSAKITFPFAGADTYTFAQLTSMTYDVSKIRANDLFSYTKRHADIAERTWNHEAGVRDYQHLVVVSFDKIVKESVDDNSIYRAAFAMDKGANTSEYKTIAYNRVNNISIKLDLAIALNDVDKIIDSLLQVKDVTATQVSGIITPINAVELDYRKAEILKVLNNINGWCTIKLYDDQTTWEPLIAKIRAMISVRK